MKEMIKNIRSMWNEELIGLAKNRFLPTELQMAIADNSYRRAHIYLIENSGLAPEVRDYLWSDRANSGYLYKTLLISNGHYPDREDKYLELFERYPGAWSRSAWRMKNAFVDASPRYWLKARGLTAGSIHTPAHLLNRIYDTHYCLRDRHVTRSNAWTSNYNQKIFVEHPNCDLTLAIKISQCGISEVEQKAFSKIVELSK